MYIQNCCRTKYLHFLTRVSPVLLFGQCLCRAGSACPVRFFCTLDPIWASGTGVFTPDNPVTPSLRFCVDLVSERLW